MAGKALNFKVCSPLKPRSGLTGKYYAICHYSYNLLLCTSLDQFVSMLSDVEWNDHQNRKIERGIKNTQFHYKASIENIIYDEMRNIDRSSILRLEECNYVEKCENILITGSTGIGKVIWQQHWGTRLVSRGTG